MRSLPATMRCSGASSPSISSARSTLAPAATAALALRRRFASSKFASRFAVPRTARRILRSSQASTLSWAPSLVSIALIASPSRITTRSTPRTSRAFADLQPPRGADHGQRRLRSRAGELERHGSARLGQRTVGQEGAAPGRLAVARAARHDLPRQPAHGPAARVHEPGLPGQAVAVLDHPHDVAVALAQPARREHDELGAVPEYLADVLAQPARGGAGVEFGLDHNVAVVQVEAASEP